VRGEVCIRHIRQELGDTRIENRDRRMGAARIQGRMSQFVHQRPVRRIGGTRFQFRNACRAHCIVDDAAVCEELDAEVGGMLQRSRNIQRCSEQLARAREELLATLDAAPLGRVAQQHGEDARAVHIELRDGRFRRKLLTGAAQTGDLLSFAHPAGRNRRCGEVANVLAVHRAEPLRQQDIQRPTEDLRRRPAEDLLRALVEQHDALVLVHRDDRIRCDRHDAGEVRRRNAQRARSRLDRRFIRSVVWSV
jgi:hypothetical protein